MVTFAAATPRSAMSTGPAADEAEAPPAGEEPLLVGAAGISAPRPRPSPRRRSLTGSPPPCSDCSVRPHGRSARRTPLRLRGGRFLWAASDTSEGTTRSWIVGQHRLAVTRGLGQTDRAKDAVRSTSSPKWLRTSSATWDARRVRPSYMVSRIVETWRLGLMPPHQVDVTQELAQAFQRVVLTLDRNEDLRTGDQRVDREETE